jgi:hypothetical protein
MQPAAVTGALLAAVRLVWQSSPRGFLTAAALQILGAVSALGVVLVGKVAIEAIVRAEQSSTEVEDLVRPWCCSPP